MFNQSGTIFKMSISDKADKHTFGITAPNENQHRITVGNYTQISINIIPYENISIYIFKKLIL